MNPPTGFSAAITPKPRKQLFQRNDQRAVVAASFHKQSTTIFFTLERPPAGRYRQKVIPHIRDVALAQLRTQLRLAHDWQLITDAQFERGTRMSDATRRMLGAWPKTARKNDAAR
jgi:hypothetical protein